MLSREENELITRVGRGTPMGSTMRMYWIPALLAREIAEPDGPPVRVRLWASGCLRPREREGSSAKGARLAASVRVSAKAAPFTRTVKATY